MSADVRPAACEHRVQHLLRVLGRQPRHRTGQDVAQHAVPGFEQQRVAFGRIDQRRERFPFDACGAADSACRDNTAAPAPSPNRQALISTPGSLSRYIAALLTSTQIDSTCRHVRPPATHPPGASSAAPPRSPGRPDRTPATSARSPRRSIDVTGQARAEVAGAGADRPRASMSPAASAASSQRRRAGGRRRAPAHWPGTGRAAYRDRSGRLRSAMSTASERDVDAVVLASGPFRRSCARAGPACRNQSEALNASQHSALL